MTGRNVRRYNYNHGRYGRSATWQRRLACIHWLPGEVRTPLDFRTLHSFLASVFLAASLLTIGCESRPPADIRLTTDSSGNTISAVLIGPNVRDADLASLVKYTGLQDLHLQECSQITDAGLAKLTDLSSRLTKLSLIRIPVSDAGMKFLANARTLKDLTLAHTNVSGSGLQHLANSPLARLSLQSRSVKADALAELSKLAGLEELELQCQDITLGSLPILGSLKKMTSLVAFRTPVGKGGLESLRGLSQLRKLILSSSEIDDESIDAINSLSGLEEVEFATASITNEGLKKIKLPKLRDLSLDTCVNITDEGLANLTGMPELERLMLGGTSVQGKDLTPLAVLRKLKIVLLKASQFKGNDQSIQNLQGRLPECQVSIMRG